MLIKAIDLRYRYDDQEENLLEKINCEISRRDKIGLIGDNGSGKTTLLQLLCGDLEADAGQIIRRRKGVSIGFLRQEMSALSNLVMIDEVKTVFADIYHVKTELESTERLMSQKPNDISIIKHYGELQDKFEKLGGYSVENRIETVLTGLEFTESDCSTPYMKLSSGQRSRVELAKLLLKEPDVLFLDEPTNHLDIPTLEWLEAFLQHYSNGLLIVSHDRYFLDQVVTKIWEINHRQLRIYSGNYSFYAYERELKAKQEEEEYRRKRREIKRLKRAADERTQKAKKVAGKPHKLSNYDPFSKPFYRTKAAKIEKRAKVIQHRIEKIGKIEKPKRKRDIHLDFRIDKQSSHFVCVGRNLTKAYGSKILFQNIDFSLTAGQRVAIIGPNGCGKTTLLKILLGEEQADSGEILLGNNLQIGYSSQELSHLDFNNSILSEIMTEAKDDQSWVRTVLGCLKLEQDKVFQTIESLSLGERNKVSMAKMLLSHANFLILDEPTNHLDISTCETIESALLEYPGTILFVSHDRRFIEKVADDVWDFWRQ